MHHLRECPIEPASIPFPLRVELNKLRVLSYLILGIGVICIALSQVMNRFRYKEMTEIRREGPLGYGYDNETIYWWDACVNREPAYRYSTNSTLGTLSRGEIIEIDRFGFGGAEEGYAWNEKAYKIVNGQMESVSNESPVIWQSFDSSKMGGFAALTLFAGNNRCFEVRIYNGVANESWTSSYEVDKEGMPYILELDGNANQPFFITVDFRIIPPYEGYAEPLLYLGLVVIGAGIVVCLFSLRRFKQESTETLRE